MRKIIHCDADCFFAALELRDDPSLKGRPIAVGGASDRRGVIATCNYEARAYGVHSAMASAYARRLCPELLLLPARFEIYREAATQIREIFSDYSDRIEPLSLDEAYIDVSESELFKGSATLIANEIRQKVYREVGITVSAGVAPNKFLAKVASDWNKPNGLCVISPDEVDEFVKQLPVNKLFGVGRVTADKLHRMGIYTCAEMRDFSQAQLVQRFGSFGVRLHQLSLGQDDREVKNSRRRKSISVEHTYSEDIKAPEACLAQLPALLEKFSSRCEALDDSYQIEKQFVKVKFDNFQSTTVECVIQGKPRLSIFKTLCLQAIERGQGRAVRLLGLGVRLSSAPDITRQLILF
ncbi:DNA polymerase IV [bacterium]|nr:DNA polymerase IV [bacterium]